MKDNIRLLYSALHELEKARVWGGMEWSYTFLHPRYYLKARELLEQYIKEKEEDNG